MPLTWDEISEEAPALSGAFSHAAGDAPLARLVVWPHRSMTPEGFATFIAVTFILLLMPLMMVLGTPVFWFLLPFLMGTLWMAWIALRRNNADARLTETLNVWSDRLELIRQNPRGDCQRWEANPYWVSLRLRDDSGPVPKYLTLKGNGREVELGAFLSPEERATLYEDLDRLLRRLPAKA